ncbi:hypothetical protein HID58_078971 [Brassica napus]|uniref:Uncharacterized protein n=1 Tax=Brassica napus TaxID=3708 RepID=A0ABQ7XEF5_BRANA|nr:hypothetical protein HID58_078971 [Brassica napus]
MGLRNMGQDYSYTQPSSSDEFDNTSLLLVEAAMYADEAESSYNRAQPSFEGLQGEYLTSTLSLSSLI